MSETATTSTPASSEASTSAMSEAIANAEASVEQNTGAPNEEQQVDETITPEEEAELALSEGEEKTEEGKEEKQAEPVRKKLKIDGEEVELTEEEWNKYASLGKAAQKRMQEAAEVRKQHEKLQQDVNTLLSVLQSDPARVLNDLGVNPEEFANSVINKKLEEEAKSPEQKEKEEMLQKLQDAEKKLKDAEEQRKKEEQERLTQEAASKIEKDISDAIESSNMPKHPYFVRKVADLLLLATSQGIDVEANDVIPIAKKQITDEFRSLTGVMPEELLEEILGNDKVASLRRRYLKKLKQTPATTVKNIKSTGTEAKKEDGEKKYIKSKDFFKNLGTF